MIAGEYQDVPDGELSLARAKHGLDEYRAVRIALVQPPVIDVRERAMLTPPLGLLTLGAVLRKDGAEVEVVDLNLKCFQEPAWLDPDAFYTLAVERIEAARPEVVGFTSMALDSHVCLGLAERLKARNPRLVTVFGGPHFGTIARPLLERYPWTDYVIVGEAENAILGLVRHLRSPSIEGVPGNVAYRTSDGVRFTRAATRTRLDDLPLPDYELIDLEGYFEQNGHRLACLEQSRGCQLRCAFCYSEAHWGHGERVKSPQRVVSEMKDLVSRGVETVFFVGDNFLTNRDHAQVLCSAIEEARLPLSWSCYATLAQVTPPMARRLARAGCRSVFIGVDAVSAAAQKSFRKTYFKGSDRLGATVDSCLREGIVPTCSFMLSSADSDSGLEATLSAALVTRARGARVCLNALAIYNDCALHREGAGSPEYDATKPRLLFRTPEVNHHNPYAERDASLFPMHQAAPSTACGTNLFRLCHVASTLIRAMPITLLHYGRNEGRRLLHLFARIADDLPEPHYAADGMLGPEGSKWTLNALRRAFSEVPWIADLMICDLLPACAPETEHLPTVHVKVDDTTHGCKLSAHHVMRLPYSPCPSTGPTAETAGSTFETYLYAVAFGEGHWLHVDTDLAEAMRAMRPDGGSWPLSSRAFSRLVESRVLLPAFPVLESQQHASTLGGSR